MLSPNDIIGQRVWIEVPRDPDYPYLDPYRVKAILTQPTSPPWFYARFEEAPRMVREAGKWLTLNEAQQAVLIHPVIDDYELDELDELPYDEEDEFELN